MKKTHSTAYAVLCILSFFTELINKGWRMHTNIYDLQYNPTAEEIISLEGSIFVDINNKLNNLKEFINQTVTDYISKLHDDYNLHTTSTVSALSKLKKRLHVIKSDIPTDAYDMRVTVPKGFGVPYLRVLQYMDKHIEDTLKDTIKSLESTDDKLSKILTMESEQKALSKEKSLFDIDDIIKRDKSLTDLLDKKSGGMVDIRTLVDNGTNYEKGVAVALDVFSNVKMSYFKTLKELSSSISEKTVALRELIIVENEEITKQALENVMVSIDASARLETLSAKYMMMAFEISRSYLEIDEKLKKAL